MILKMARAIVREARYLEALRVIAEAEAAEVAKAEAEVEAAQRAIVDEPEPETE